MKMREVKKKEKQKLKKRRKCEKRKREEQNEENKTTTVKRIKEDVSVLFVWRPLNFLTKGEMLRIVVIFLG